MKRKTKNVTLTINGKRTSISLDERTAAQIPARSIRTEYVRRAVLTLWQRDQSIDDPSATFDEAVSAMIAKNETSLAGIVKSAIWYMAGAHAPAQV